MALGIKEVAELAHRPRSSEGGTRTKVEFFLTVASLPRPNNLLVRQPYYLTMPESHKVIEVQKSHNRSLQLLANNLKRWCRVNHHGTTNVCASLFYRGMMLPLPICRPTYPDPATCR